ncbi:MAG: hypothetical protein AAF202_09610, partial [Pseudomonadota bacterium]
MQKLDSKHEGEHEFVLLKEGAANHGIERVCEVVVQDFDSLFNVFAALGISDPFHEKIDEPVQRVLVHGIDRSEIGDAKEEKGSPMCYRPVRGEEKKRGKGEERRAKMSELSIYLIESSLT